MKTNIFILITLALIFANCYKERKDDPNDHGTLECSDKTHIYTYKSVMQYAKSDGKEKSNSETSAIVENTCIQETTLGDLLFHFRLLDLNLTVRGEYKLLKKSDYQDFSAFTLSKNGKLKQFWTSPREAANHPDITTVKKGIVQKFQTKLNGKQRLQHSQEGDIIVHYTQRVQEDGSLLIQGSKTPKDVLKPADPHQRRRDSHTRTTKYTMVKGGVIHQIVQVTDDTVGRHKKTEKEKTIKYSAKDTPPNLSSKTMFSMESRSKTVLIATADKVIHNEKDSKVMALLHEEEDVLAALNKMNDLEEQPLGLDPRQIKKTETHHKKRLEKEVDFKNVLKELKIKEDPEILALASDYAKYLKKKAFKHIKPIIMEIINKKKVEHDERNYAKTLLTLLASIGTDKAQEILIKALRHQHLKFNAKVAIVDLKKPNKKLQKVLLEISKNADPHKNTEANNAHLTLAYVASRLQEKEDKEKIVVHLLEQMAKAQTFDELEFHLHALSNAGEAVPLEVYSKILESPLHVQGKVILANSLANRVSEDGDEETTAFIHSILASDVHEAVKVAAVGAQVEREHVLQNSASVLEFKQYLENEQTTGVLAKALRAYYEEADIHPSELDDAKVLEARVLWGRFFRRIGRAFRSVARRIGGHFKRIGHHIRRAVSRVGSFIKKAAQKAGAALKKVGVAIYNGVKKVVDGIANAAKGVANFAKNLKAQFGKAEFEGQQVCIPANKNGDKLCMYDEEMVAFIRSQGDLSIMKWSKQFTFEKLIGAKVLHVYIGAVGYGGTAIDCENNTLDAAFFARGSFYGKIFNRRINVLTMSIELQKRHDQDLKDLAYIKLGPAVLLNKQFVPENIRRAINMCEKQTKPLIRKTFNNLAQFQFTIVIVVVPVRFGFVLTADMGIDLVYTICPSRLTLNVGVEPWFTLSIRAEAGISIFIAHGGVSVTASFNYRLKPSVGTANCNICAILAQEIKPITIQVDAYASAFGKRWAWKIYKWEGPTIKNELFRKCLKNGKYEPYDPDNPGAQPENPPAVTQPENPPNQPETPSNNQPENPPQQNTPQQQVTPQQNTNTPQQNTITPQQVPQASNGNNNNQQVSYQQQVVYQQQFQNQQQYVQNQYALNDINQQRFIIAQQYYSLMNYRNQLYEWARRKSCE